MFRPTQRDALNSLVTGVSFSSRPNGDGTFTITHWDLTNEGVAQPTDEAINAELTRLQTEYDAQEYARKRQAEYPSIEELVVALYDTCLLYTSPSPRDRTRSRMPSSA